MNVPISLPVEEWNVVVAGLGELPLKMGLAVFEKVRAAVAAAEAAAAPGQEAAPGSPPPAPAQEAA